MLKSLAIIIFALMLSSNGFAEEKIANPCANTSSILTFVNRPSQSDSACPIPFKKMDVEMGYQYFDLTGGGHDHEFPEAAIHIGLPFNSEFITLVPSYNIQNVEPLSGFTASTLGIKHRMATGGRWVLSAEGLITPASGSQGFGTAGTGEAVNGILAYAFTSSLSMTAMAGVSSQTWPEFFGGGRYTSFNPDVLLDWQITPKWQVYGETFAQTKTGPDQGFGYNFNEGVLYLVKNYLEIDAVLGQRANGLSGGYNNFIGTGFAILIG
jgi:hypothetical protein